MKIISAKSRNFIYGAYALAMVLLLCIGYLSVLATKENEENIGSVLQTHKVLTESERLYSEVKDAQRAQRGYLLTEDEVYLREFSTSKDSVFKTITKLEKMTAEQPAQLQRLQELTSLANETFNYWQKTIALNQNNERAAALSFVRKGFGYDLVLRIGNLITDFKKYEEALLEQRNTEYVKSRRIRGFIETVGGVLALFLLTLSLLILRKLLEREKQLSTTLEERVEARTEELRKSLLDLSRTNEELDNFVYTASHDLRSPVVNLQGIQQVLKNSVKDRATPKELEYLRLMDVSIERLNRTIVELANIAKVTREHQLTEVLFFSDVYHDVLTDVAPLVEKTHAKIITDFGVDYISYPHAHLKSILYNLLSNAVKYHSPDRSPVVKITTFKDEGKICLSVTDNGLGLDQAEVNKLFHMYKRLHNHVEGSGVGLTMIRRIIENQGGKIMVTSRKGEGSTFTVIF